MKVICIAPAGPLIHNEVYIVIGINGLFGYILAEVIPPEEYKGFLRSRFRPIEEKGDMFIEEFIIIDEEEKKYDSQRTYP